MFVLVEIPHFSCQFGYDLDIRFVVLFLDLVYLQTHAASLSVFIFLFSFARKWIAVLKTVYFPLVSVFERRVHAAMFDRAIRPFHCL